MKITVPSEFVTLQDTRNKTANYSSRKNMDYEILEYIELQTNPNLYPPTHYWLHDAVTADGKYIEYKHINGKYLNLTLKQVSRYREAYNNSLLTHFKLWKITRL